MKFETTTHTQKTNKTSQPMLNNKKRLIKTYVRFGVISIVNMANRVKHKSRVKQRTNLSCWQRLFAILAVSFRSRSALSTLAQAITHMHNRDRKVEVNIAIIDLKSKQLCGNNWHERCATMLFTQIICTCCNAGGLAEYRSLLRTSNVLYFYVYCMYYTWANRLHILPWQKKRTTQVPIYADRTTLLLYSNKSITLALLPSEMVCMRTLAQL